MQPKHFYLIFFLLAFLPGCLIKPIEVPNPWEDVLGFEMNTPIKSMYSDGVQLYVAADDEFARISGSGNLLERRPLPLPFRFFSRPIMGRHCFGRVVRRTAQGLPELELRMNNNPDFVLSQEFNSLSGTSQQAVFPEEDSRYSGSFNVEGDLMILPVINISENRHDFYLIDIEFDATKNSILSTEATVVSVPELPAAFGSISNIRFLNGFFYVVTLDGTFRISTDGDYSKIFQTHLWDLFESQNRFYAVDRGSILHESEDNGETWVPKPDQVVLQHVETAGDYVLTHQALGFPFAISDDDFQAKKDLLLNENFPQDFAAYRQILFFEEAYYLNVQKHLYKVDDLQTVD
ncbi:MAG: hypothetical protein HKN16_03865 [Saprospiraceae bacterium]|nr:hypothetical protein [Saprospiraceae bacterium]